MRFIIVIIGALCNLLYVFNEVHNKEFTINRLYYVKIDLKHCRRSHRFACVCVCVHWHTDLFVCALAYNHILIFVCMCGLMFTNKVRNKLYMLCKNLLKFKNSKYIFVSLGKARNVNEIDSCTFHRHPYNNISNTYKKFNSSTLAA